MNPHHLQLGIVQHPCNEDYETNLRRSEEGVRACAARGAELVLLPELHAARYFCQTEDPSHFDLAEPIPGPTSERLGQLASELGIVIAGSVFERRAAGLYHNTAIVLERDGSLAGQYRKMHIPDDPGYYEKYYFTPGDQGFQPIDTSLGRLGVLVCWDQWYPEAARLMALAGAELLLYPSAIGWDEWDNPAEQERQKDAWLTIQRAHAIANALPVAASNRCGVETATPSSPDSIHFWGHSFICGPQGEYLDQAGKDPRIVLADLDLSRTETLRREWPYLRDRRIDAYAGLTRRFNDGR